MAEWTTPADWLTDAPITATRLNTEIVENLKFLKRTPRDTVTIRNGTSLTVTSTSFVAVDDAQFTIELDCSGGDVVITFQGLMSNTGIGSINRFDVLMDNTTYLSSGTGTPLSNGLLSQYNIANGSPMNYGFTHRIENLAAGVHNFKLRWAVSANTGTLLLANSTTQFSCKED